jgi:outer membrane receptor protein involved in Fe transport
MIQRWSVGVWLSAVCLVVALPRGAVSAQELGTVAGSVLNEASDEPLSGATIEFLDAGISVQSAVDGSFVASLPPGAHTVRVELAGYVSTTDRIELAADEVGFVRFYLGRVEAVLQGIAVRVMAGNGPGPSVEIDRGDRSPRSALDLLREQVPGVLVRNRPGATGIRIRGSSSLLASRPVIYLDGVLLADGGGLSAAQFLEQVPAERVLRIRVLRGPSAAAQYGDAASGVILVETR